MKRPRSFSLLMLGLTAYFVLSARSGGCSKSNTTTLFSPVQAVAMVVEHPDGEVTAELVLISTAVNPSVFVDTADNVELDVNGQGTVPLELTSSGHYTASSEEDSNLVYIPGGRYRFSFELEDSSSAGNVAGGLFVADVEAASDVPTVEVPEAPPGPLYTVDIRMGPTGHDWGRGILIVRDEGGNETWRNVDFSTPAFDGSKWASLAIGNTHTLPAEAFPESGRYEIELQGMTFVQGFDDHLSDELGFLSGFLAGSSASTTVVVP